MFKRQNYWTPGTIDFSTLNCSQDKSRGAGFSRTSQNPFEISFISFQRPFLVIQKLVGLYLYINNQNFIKLWFNIIKLCIKLLLKDFWQHTIISSFGIVFILLLSDFKLTNLRLVES